MIRWSLLKWFPWGKAEPHDIYALNLHTHSWIPFIISCHLFFFNLNISDPPPHNFKEPFTAVESWAYLHPSNLPSFAFSACSAYQNWVSLFLTTSQKNLHYSSTLTPSILQKLILICQKKKEWWLLISKPNHKTYVQTTIHTNFSYHHCLSILYFSFTEKLY